MKHTKGPWKERKLFETPILVDAKEGRSEWYTNTIDISGNDGRIICSVVYQTDTEKQGWGHNNSVELFESNAKLIAKAPEMIEALKDQLNFLDIVYSRINYPGDKHLNDIRHDINSRKEQIRYIIEELN